MRLKNLLKDIPADLPQEFIETLVEARGIRIERIVSKGQSTSPDDWYDQDQDEWVLLLQGEAQLRIEGRDELLHLHAGDYVNLPAHLRHRVEWTAVDRESVWLAVYY